MLPACLVKGKYLGWKRLFIGRMSETNDTHDYTTDFVGWVIQACCERENMILRLDVRSPVPNALNMSRQAWLRYKLQTLLWPGL